MECLCFLLASKYCQLLVEGGGLQLMYDIQEHGQASAQVRQMVSSILEEFRMHFTSDRRPPQPQGPLWPSGLSGVLLLKDRVSFCLWAMGVWNQFLGLPIVSIYQLTGYFSLWQKDWVLGWAVEGRDRWISVIWVQPGLHRKTLSWENKKWLGPFYSFRRGKETLGRPWSCSISSAAPGYVWPRLALSSAILLFQCWGFQHELPHPGAFNVLFPPIWGIRSLSVWMCGVEAQAWTEVRIHWKFSLWKSSDQSWEKKTAEHFSACFSWCGHKAGGFMRTIPGSSEHHPVCPAKLEQSVDAFLSLLRSSFHSVKFWRMEVNSKFLCACVCVCVRERERERVLHVWAWCPLRSGLELGPPHGCWEPNPSPLEEQQMILTAEPSLQALDVRVLCF
jgi:hypothetical protein